MANADLPFPSPDPLVVLAALDVQLDLARFLLDEMHAVLERLRIPRIVISRFASS